MLDSPINSIAFRLLIILTLRVVIGLVVKDVLRFLGTFLPLGRGGGVPLGFGFSPTCIFTSKKRRASR